MSGGEAGIRYGIAQAGNRIVKGNKAGTLEDQFRTAVMDTVQAFWDRLHRCPRCGSIFLKVWKQKFCSPTCASRTPWDAFKARRGERDYRTEYQRRTQKKLEPGAKVKIKPRRSR